MKHKLGIEWPGLVSHIQRNDPGRPMCPKLGRAVSALFRAAGATAAGGWVVCFLVARLGAGEATGPPGAATRSNAFLHPEVIKRPAGTPKVATGLTNFHGQPVMVACSSCHATTTPNIDTRATIELDEFHQGLKYVHGNLTCLSCHNAKNYDTLRLADSRSVEFPNVMTLCSQCHGPQRRDYDMGLHGGMNGHWDLARGGRTRNTCINCHDPHAPAFPLVMPVFPPRDRISVPAKPKATPAKH
jgi:formate-dependent nitrite reductase cytochrome c552 subunit